LTTGCFGSQQQQAQPATNPGPAGLSFAVRPVGGVSFEEGLK